MEHPLALLARSLKDLGLTPQMDPTGSRLEVAPEVSVPGLSRPLVLPILEAAVEGRTLHLRLPVPLDPPPFPPGLLEAWAQVPRLLCLGHEGGRAFLQTRLPLEALTAESAPALLEAALRELEALGRLLEGQRPSLPEA